MVDGFNFYSIQSFESFVASKGLCELLKKERKYAESLFINFIMSLSCQGFNIFADQPQITHLEIHFYNTAVAKMAPLSKILAKSHCTCPT